MINFYWRACGMGALLEVGKGISEGTTTYIITEQIERNLKATMTIAPFRILNLKVIKLILDVEVIVLYRYRAHNHTT